MDENYAIRVPILRASFDKAIEGTLVIDIVHGGTVTEPFRRKGERNRSGGSCFKLADVRVTGPMAVHKGEKPLGRRHARPSTATYGTTNYPSEPCVAGGVRCVA